MISLSTFLVAVDQNRARINEYQSGGDGGGGKCDCIGLIIGAVRLSGAEWPWTHGSNYTARNKIDNLRPVYSVSDLLLGDCVFKAHEPGESGYDADTINGSYKNSPDKRDYYHVGVVTSVQPLEITHCTSVSGGIKRDNSLGKWRFAGELSLVNYDEDDIPAAEETALYTAIVQAQNGLPVKMRSKPSTNGSILAKADVGTKVEVLEVLDGWAKIRYGGQTGYMMTKFLQDEPPATSEGTITREQLESIEASLAAALELVRAALNGGGVG